MSSAFVLGEVVGRVRALYASSRTLLFTQGLRARAFARTLRSELAPDRVSALLWPN